MMKFIFNEVVNSIKLCIFWEFSENFKFSRDLLLRTDTFENILQVILTTIACLCEDC